MHRLLIRLAPYLAWATLMVAPSLARAQSCDTHFEACEVTCSTSDDARCVEDCLLDVSCELDDIDLCLRYASECSRTCDVDAGCLDDCMVRSPCIELIEAPELEEMPCVPQCHAHCGDAQCSFDCLARCERIDDGLPDELCNDTYPVCWDLCGQDDLCYVECMLTDGCMVTRSSGATKDVP